VGFFDHLITEFNEFLPECTWLKKADRVYLRGLSRRFKPDLSKSLHALVEESMDLEVELAHLVARFEYERDLAEIDVELKRKRAFVSEADADALEVRAAVQTKTKSELPPADMRRKRIEAATTSSTGHTRRLRDLARRARLATLVGKLQWGLNRRQECIIALNKGA